MELGGLLWTSVLKLALPPQRHSTDSWLEHEGPFIHPAQNKRERQQRYKASYEITMNTNKMDNLEEMDKFPVMYNFPRLNQE